MLEVSYSWRFQVYFLRHVNRHLEQCREKYRNYEHWDKTIKRRQPNFHIVEIQIRLSRVNCNELNDKMNAIS